MSRDISRDRCFIGAKFNRLEVIGPPISEKTLSSNGRTYTKWKCLCRCSCGVEKPVLCSGLVDNGTKSCGCLNLENIKKKGRCLKYSNSDLIKHPLYNCYKGMKTRCYNKKTKEYFGGNIIICKEWLGNFEEFYNWAIDKWSDKLVLSRKDMTGNFSPDNCLFISHKEATEGNFDVEKMRATMNLKYGGWFTTTKEHKDKVNKTCLEKYGKNWATQVEEFKEKRKETNLDRYGYEQAGSNPDVREKVRLTCQERYGTNSPSQNKEILAKQNATCVEKYGTPYFNQCNLTTQNKVTSWLLSEGFEFKSDYKVLEGREIDLYNENLKFGIEYCGLYWHTESKVGNDRHKYKFDKCKENGITLFTIFSDEWLLRPNQTKSLILSALNKFEKTIDVKDCRVLELEPMRAKGFLNKNHIIHSDISKDFNIGIYYEGYLESVYSFIKDGNSLILDRFANSLNCNMLNGFQSMLTLAIKYCKDNNLNSIIGISDNRYPNEAIYIQNGFQFESDLEPDYQYVNISNPKKRFYKTNIDNTEGYDKIYDCGKKKFILTI